MPIKIPDHSDIFIDANIFVYHFSGPTVYTDACTEFLQCIEEGKLSGITSTIVMAETLYRLMVIEAIGKLNIEPKNVLRRLKAHPLDVKKLTSIWQYLRRSKPLELRFYQLRWKTSIKVRRSR